MARDPLDVIEQKESRGRNVPNYKYGPGYSASGYYQIIDETWRRWAKAAGIDISKYPTAMSAPKEVQGAVAAQGFKMEGFRPWKAAEDLVGQEANYGQPTSKAVARDLPAKPAGMTASEYVRELQLGDSKIRNLPINPGLRSVLNTAGAKTGLIAEIGSGGQHAHGERRTGSTRHDVDSGDIGAADLKLRDPQTNRVLNLTNDEDRARIADYVRTAREAGATGFGAGRSYMGDETLHIGGGKPATWGDEAAFLKDAGGKSTTAAAAPAAPPTTDAPLPNSPLPESATAEQLRGILAEDDPFAKLAEERAAEERTAQQVASAAAAARQQQPAPQPPPAPVMPPIAPPVDYSALLLPRLKRGLLAEGGYGGLLG